MTPIEAATTAVRTELGKMAHDPREIARKAVKAFLQAEIDWKLSSTGEHALEDTLYQVASRLSDDTRPMSFNYQPVIPRVPPPILGTNIPQANNEVQVTPAETSITGPSPFITAINWTTPGRLYPPVTPPPAPVANKNCWTAALLDKIKDDEPTLIPSVFTDLPRHPDPDEDVVLVFETSDDDILTPVLESEVILWLYKELVDMGFLRDNDVLDLSLTAEAAGLDSLDAVELVISAEYAFTIEISDEAIDAAQTLHDIVTTIVTLRNK